MFYLVSSKWDLACPKTLLVDKCHKSCSIFFYTDLHRGGANLNSAPPRTALILLFCIPSLWKCSVIIFFCLRSTRPMWQGGRSLAAWWWRKWYYSRGVSSCGVRVVRQPRGPRIVCYILPWFPPFVLHLLCVNDFLLVWRVWVTVAQEVEWVDW